MQFNSITKLFTPAGRPTSRIRLDMFIRNTSYLNLFIVNWSRLGQFEHTIVETSLFVNFFVVWMNNNLVNQYACNIIISTVSEVSPKIDSTALKVTSDIVLFTKWNWCESYIFHIWINAAMTGGKNPVFRNKSAATDNITIRVNNLGNPGPWGRNSGYTAQDTR